MQKKLKIILIALSNLKMILMQFQFQFLHACQQKCKRFTPKVGKIFKRPHKNYMPSHVLYTDKNLTDRKSGFHSSLIPTLYLAY